MWKIENEIVDITDKQLLCLKQTLAQQDFINIMSSWFPSTCWDIK